MMPSDAPANGPERVTLAAAPRKRAGVQPLDIVETDGGLLTLDTVMQLTGLGKSKIYAMMQAGTFPEVVKIASRAVRWRSEEIRVWMARRLQGRGPPVARGTKQDA